MIASVDDATPLDWHAVHRGDVITMKNAIKAMCSNVLHAWKGLPSGHIGSLTADEDMMVMGPVVEWMFESCIRHDAAPLLFLTSLKWDDFARDFGDEIEALRGRLCLDSQHSALQETASKPHKFMAVVQAEFVIAKSIVTEACKEMLRLPEQPQPDGAVGSVKTVAATVPTTPKKIP